MAQPPIPPKNPLIVLAIPCAMDSRFALPLLAVISSTMFSVRSDSTNPTPAITKEYGKISCNVSQLRGTLGKCRWGNVPLTEAISTTFLVSIPKTETKPNITRIAIREAGTAFVIRGNPITINIVSSVSPPIMYKVLPDIHSAPCPVFTLNWTT